MMWLTLATIFLMSVALTSLAIGLGALFPNFKEDNPAWIANGLGGTLNIVLSMLYIGGVIAMMAVPVFLYYTDPDVRCGGSTGCRTRDCLSFSTFWPPWRRCGWGFGHGAGWNFNCDLPLDFIPVLFLLS